MSSVYRCQQCQKKVGLLGFECKCKKTYCSRCRYAEQHKCPYDYIAEHRAELIKANPKVCAEKITSI